MCSQVSFSDERARDAVPSGAASAAPQHDAEPILGEGRPLDDSHAAREVGFGPTRQEGCSARGTPPPSASAAAVGAAAISGERASDAVPSGATSAAPQHDADPALGKSHLFVDGPTRARRCTSDAVDFAQVPAAELHAPPLASRLPPISGFFAEVCAGVGTTSRAFDHHGLAPGILFETDSRKAASLRDALPPQLGHCGKYARSLRRKLNLKQRRQQSRQDRQRARAGGG